MISFDPHILCWVIPFYWTTMRSDPRSLDFYWVMIPLAERLCSKIAWILFINYKIIPSDGSDKNILSVLSTPNTLLLVWHFQLTHTLLLSSLKKYIDPSHPNLCFLVPWRNYDAERWSDFIKGRKWGMTQLIRPKWGLGLPTPYQLMHSSLAFSSCPCMPSQCAAVWTCKRCTKQVTRLDLKRESQKEL